MKMVSAAKLRKAQDAIEGMRPYVQKLGDLLQNLNHSIDNEHSDIYSSERDLSKVLIVVITSNRGLCGGFNSNVIKQTKKIIAEKYKDISVDILTIGRKGYDLLKMDYHIVANESSLYEEVTFANTVKIASYLMEKFADKTYDKVELIYNHFKKTVTQIVKIEPFLPLQKTTQTTSNTHYIFEPNQQEIVENLIPKSLKVQLFKAIRDSIAAEHGARMIAMHKATDNANELKAELLLTYNRARQAAITSEILEIVAGAEALKP